MSSTTREYVSGYSQISSSLRAVGNSLSAEILTSTLKSLAVPVVEQIKDDAPKDTGDLTDSVGVVEAKATAPDAVAVVICTRKSFAHWFLGHMHEWGTKFMPKHPFFRPAWDSQSDGLTPKFGKVAWSRIKSAIVRTGLGKRDA